jgi:hypothetical protein
MKKTYMQPLAVVLGITTASIVAATGDDTTTENVHDTEIDGEDAWSRRQQHRRNDWDEEEEGT